MLGDDDDEVEDERDDEEEREEFEDNRNDADIENDNLADIIDFREAEDGNIFDLMHDFEYN